MRYRFLRFPDGKAKAVTFSYDDGVLQDIKLANICSEYGIKCTFNINSAFAANAPLHNRMSYREIQQHILSAGHEVAVHGHQHIAPGLSSAIDFLQDVLQCRSELERNFHSIICGMAYPDVGITNCNSSEYQRIKNNLMDLGIVYARTLGSDNEGFALPNDWYAWIPTAHHNNPRILKYAENFVNLKQSSTYITNHTPRLFYMWGHSYEFDRDNNWDLLDDICLLLSRKDDIWYATNMEICKYVRAYNSLQFSVDNHLVYNPTLLDIWFEADGQIYSIQSGQTLQLDKEIS